MKHIIQEDQYQNIVKYQKYCTKFLLNKAHIDDSCQICYKKENQSYCMLSTLTFLYRTSTA